MSDRSARAWVLGVVGLCGALFAACGDDSVAGAGGFGANNTGSPGGGGATGGSAQGAGGEGGDPFSCAECVFPQNICIDDASCGQACPSERAACHTSASPNDPDICCEAGSQCCDAATNGYAAGDRCVPAEQQCPIECPGGALTCEDGDYCALDAETGAYSCTADCDPVNVCGGLCCPLGATCGDDGACVLADLTIDAEQVEASLIFDSYTFQEGSCSFFEGCIGALGERNLMRFDLRTPNIGDGDMLLGDPTGNPLFKYSPCHEHYHFDGYANYRLLDLNGVEVAQGHKQAFCLLDWEPYAPDAPPNSKYHCGYQGIQKGWADTYENNLPCQWVDITGVPAGSYMLELTLNIDHTLAEKDYTNNSALVPIQIP
ncbi:MAG: hypothetical protein IPG04_02175 [Polyangiaceae bacterium]|nr:hypothetical protein [Polyangiaceae bacterium]